MSTQPPAPPTGTAAVPLPRIAIQFCTQCKWMLRAAYFAQELLSTFGPALGEVALQPATGGVFTVSIQTSEISKILWDRKTEGGFPETKELKRRVRDVIEPGRDLGHVDRHGKAEPKVDPTGKPESTAEVKADSTEAKPESATAKPEIAEKTICEDCQ